MSTLSLRAGRRHFEVLLTRCALKELERCRAERFQPYRSRLTDCRERPLQTADPQGNYASTLVMRFLALGWRGVPRHN